MVVVQRGLWVMVGVAKSVGLCRGYPLLSCCIHVCAKELLSSLLQDVHSINHLLIVYQPARAQSDTPAIKRAKLDKYASLLCLCVVSSHFLPYSPSHGNVEEKCRYSLSLLKFSERRNFLGRLIFFSDTAFLEKASPHTLEAYQKILWQVESRYGPVLEAFEVEGTRERCLVIRYKMGDTSRFFRCVDLSML
jgi:hypothetical protein